MKVKPEWLVRFRQEASVQVKEARLLMAAGLPLDADAAYQHIRQLFIKAHNIKGTSSMVGLPAISEVAFELETLWGDAMRNPAQYSEQLQSLAKTGLDRLAELVGSVSSPDEKLDER